MGLRNYNEKRDFKQTPEQKGKTESRNRFRFVVQKHHASRLHFDFRLELGGVLKSWAVPKGPSMDSADKRLAVMVEDHPVSYIGFAGRIPAGNYGAGTVEIWDKGTFSPVDKSGEKISERAALAELESGQLNFVMKGKELKGAFVLIQTKTRGADKNWLLIKRKDEFTEMDLSEVSTREHKPARRSKSRSVDVKADKEEGLGEGTAGSRKIKGHIAPMLATPVDEPFNKKNWIFELKFDGFRAVIEKKRDLLLFYSRNGNSFKDRFPKIADAFKRLRRDAIIDGEIVVLNDEDKPDFQKLQYYEQNKEYPLVYYAFDLLALDGKSLKEETLIERKKMLKKLLPESEIIRYSDHVEEKGKELFKEVVANDMEGIIAKKADSVYVPGVRSSEWLKIKHHLSQEAIIVGYTEPRKSRKFFGSILLAQYDGDELRYIGHAGTGFDAKSLESLYNTMQELITDKPPVSDRVPRKDTVTWVEPKMVCEVNYSELTRDGLLRQAVFKGLRSEKSTKQVQKQTETPKPTDKVVASRATSDTPKGISGKVELTNLDKLYWPNEGITKGDLINYYDNVHKFVIPYLKDRPLTLKRNPNGIIDEGFYHKDAKKIAPQWMETAIIHSESTNEMVTYLICRDKPSLLFLANLGCIEMNPWNSTTHDLYRPDYLVLDIDPSDKNTYDDVVEVALVIKELLDRIRVKGYPKTSGASGMHIYIPCNKKYEYHQVREFAEILAVLTHEQAPELTTLERSTTRRKKDQVYVDYLQNSIGQTLASAYSVRPRPGATVSAPLEWKEIKRGLRPSQFTIMNMAARLEKKGDLFHGILGRGIDIPKSLRALEKLSKQLSR